MVPGKTYPPVALAAIIRAGAFSHVLADNRVGAAVPQATQLLKGCRNDGKICLPEPF